MTNTGEMNSGDELEETAAKEELNETQEAGAADAELELEDEIQQNGEAETDEPVETSLPDQDPGPAGVEPAHSRVWERWLLFVVAGAIIFFDQISKNLVEKSLELYTYWAPFPGLENIFRFTHVPNTGVAFGLFQNGNTIFTILAIIVSIAIIIYNGRLERGHKLLRLALGLQMGGALGNMIDRIRQGYVTDFVDVGPWPVWNIADLAVVSGTILLALIMFYDERQEKKLADQAAVGDERFEEPLESSTPHIDESPTS